MQGALLNVNGIITDLDRRQFAAWQKVAMYEYGMGLPGKLAGDFKGLDRNAALDRVLNRFNANADKDGRQELLAEQDRFYGQVLAELSEDDLVPGIKRLLVALYDHYVKLAINAPADHRLHCPGHEPGGPEAGRGGPADDDRDRGCRPAGGCRLPGQPGRRPALPDAGEGLGGYPRGQVKANGCEPTI